MDLLSSLPPEAVDLILENLPIRDAVGTSILSRDIPGGRRCYLLPSSPCADLTRLELSSCSLKPPAAKVFDVWFPNMRELRLWHVAFSGDEMAERLIAGCPRLEELTLRDFTGLSGLKIRAPNLRDVCVVGELEWVCFQNAPNAAEVSVVLVSSGSGRPVAGSVRRMLPPGAAEVLGGLLAVERLHLGFDLQFLTAGNVPKRLPIFYDHLKNVKLHMNIGDLKEILAVLCLLRSSPNVEKLRIMPSSTTISTKHAMDFWEERVNLDCVLCRLQTVKFKHIYGEKVEVEFMKFLLANSPVLDKMVIKPYAISKKRRRSILKELRQAQNASARAKILYLDA
ncbi:hypothetical protein ACLOJK_025939 [Asimina triloba]